MLKRCEDRAFARSGTPCLASIEGNHLQVLANPSCEVQESPKVTRADLKAKGIRPYDEKVSLHILCCTCLPLEDFSCTTLHWTQVVDIIQSGDCHSW